MAQVLGSDLRKWLDDKNRIAGFTVLTQNGEVVDARLIEGKYGLVWILSDDEASKASRKFVPLDDSHMGGLQNPSRSKVQKNLGMVQKFELAEARVATPNANNNLDHAEILRKQFVSYGSFWGTANWDEDDHSFGVGC